MKKSGDQTLFAHTLTASVVKLRYKLGESRHALKGSKQWGKTT